MAIFLDYVVCRICLPCSQALNNVLVPNPLQEIDTPLDVFFVLFCQIFCIRKLAVVRSTSAVPWWYLSGILS